MLDRDPAARSCLPAVVGKMGSEAFPGHRAVRFAMPSPEDDFESVAQVAAIPPYLVDTYWWAYVHPRAVRFFERQWLVNLILWGNYRRLRDAALDELGEALPGDTLQVACVYGDLTDRLS